MGVPKDKGLSECGLNAYTALRAYRYGLHGRRSIRHVNGFRVIIASEVHPNFVIPGAIAYLADFCDDASGAEE